MDTPDATTGSNALHELFELSSERWPTTVAWGTMAVLGILTNICNIAVFARYKLTSLTFYLRCLSVFDLGFCVTTVCTTVYNHYGYATYNIMIFNIYVSFPLSLTCSVLGTYTILVITVERAFGTLFPFVAQRKLSLGVSKVSMVVVTLVVAALRLPLIYASFSFCESAPGYYRQCPSTFFMTKLGLLLWVVSALVFEFIPFIILAISNGFVMRSIWKLKKNMSKLTSEEATMDPKVSLMLVGIVVLFLICEVPLTVTRIVSLPPHIQTTVDSITSSLVILNRSANMAIYLITNAEYRIRLRGLLGLRNQGKVEPSSQNSTSGTNLT